MSEEVRTMQKRREEMRVKSRKETEAVATLSGLEVERVWELANGYWPDSPDYDEVRTPWWLLQTEIGLIQLGWRKNVIHIQWDACAVRGIVTSDEVSKGDTYVHAWSTEKAIEYLRELLRMAQVGENNK